VQIAPDSPKLALVLADFLDRRHPDRNDVVIWTSSPRRAVQTAAPLGAQAGQVQLPLPAR
jgi:broad specificity phosphatase PhoE